LRESPHWSRLHLLLPCTCLSRRSRWLVTTHWAERTIVCALACRYAMFPPCGVSFLGELARFSPLHLVPTESGSSPRQKTRRRGSGTPSPENHSPHSQGTLADSAPLPLAPTASASSQARSTRRRGSGTPIPENHSLHFKDTLTRSTPPPLHPTAGASS